MSNKRRNRISDLETSLDSKNTIIPHLNIPCFLITSFIHIYKTPVETNLYFNIYKRMNITIKYHQGHDLSMIYPYFNAVTKIKYIFLYHCEFLLFEKSKKDIIVLVMIPDIWSLFIVGYFIRSNANRERLTLCRRHLIKQVIISKP